LFGLHVHSYFGIFVDLMGEESSFELVFGVTMVLENPIVCDGTNKYWHHHWVVSHLIEIFFLEQIEGEIVRFLNKLNGALVGEFFWSLSAWLLHADTHIEKLHGHIWVHH
jgi:hypothetical protein